MSLNCLNATNATYFGDIVLLHETDLLGLPNIDQGIIDELSHFLESFDLRFGMEIPGWGKIRAGYVRKIFESNLPNDVAFNRLIKTFPPEEAKVEDTTSKDEPTPVDETTGVVVSAYAAEEAKINSSEHDFTKWPLGTLALLVAYPRELPLSVRATNCLCNTRLKFFGEVILLKEADLYSVQNLGRKTAKEIFDFIHEFGLQFEMTIPGWSIEKAREIRQFIVSRLPKNVAITNLIAEGAASEIKLVSPISEDNPPNFTTWPIEQRALLVATPAELPLPPRITNALLNDEYLYIGEVAQLSMYDLLKIHNLGRKSAKELSDFRVMDLKLDLKFRVGVN